MVRTARPPLLAVATHRLGATGPRITGRRTALRVVAVELVLLGLAFATGTALTRVPPPSETSYEHWAHLTMNIAFFVTGLALFWPVPGRSQPGRALPAIARIVMVFAVMALHAGFSVWLLGLSAPVAGGFYGALQLPYVPSLLVDQRLGAVLAWALAVLALVARWARDDRTSRTDDEASYPDRPRQRRLDRLVAREPG